jgi:hypothetical protein
MAAAVGLDCGGSEQTGTAGRLVDGGGGLPMAAAGKFFRFVLATGLLFLIPLPP